VISVNPQEYGGICPGASSDVLEKWPPEAEIYWLSKRGLFVIEALSTGNF
jgi:hypothetical protein